MLVSILIPACLVFTMITVMTYRLTKGALDEQMQYEMKQQAQQSVETLQSGLKESAFSVKTAAHIIGQQERSEAELRSMLLVVKENNPDLLNIFVGYDSGKTIAALSTPLAAATDARTYPWYKSVTGEGAAFSEVYESKSAGKSVITVAYPLKSGGKRIGVIAAEISLEKLGKVMSAITVGQTGYAFLLDRAGHFVSHPTLKPTEDIFTISNGATAAYGKLYLSGSPQIIRYSFAGVPKIFSSAPVGDTGMVVVLGSSIQEFEGGINRLTGLIIALSLFGLVILSAVVFFVVEKTTKRMRLLSKRVGDLAAGDFTVGTQGSLNLVDDELGDLYKSLKTMRLNTRSLLHDIQNTAEQVAASSQQLTASAEQSAQAASLVATSIIQVAQGTEQQRGAMKEVSQDIAQRKTAVEQMALKAGQVSQSSQQAADKAQNGAQAIEQAARQMNAIEQSVMGSAQVVSNLGERSKEIGQIVETIAGIAGQTNLLALNAAIEAARAGEQGRGFAVVAEEVRKLAEQSQDAARQIGELIGEIQSETSRAVVAMELNTREVQTGSQVVQSSGETFGEILQVVQQVTSQVQEISAAVAELAAGGTKTASAVDLLASIVRETADQTGTVSAATEEQSAGLEEIASSSQALAVVAQNLRQAITKFRL
jgi:methyl-accepting chemotaxis protein